MTENKGICPKCEATRRLKHIRRREKITIRGGTFEVDVSYRRCLTCGEEFEGPGDTQDEVAEGYRQYRAKHGFIQPEEIRALREEHGLTQGELAKILGFGAVTLSRYENGMLQSAAHDCMLQTIRDPMGFSALLHRSTSRAVLSKERFEWLRERLWKRFFSGKQIGPILQAALDYDPDHLSGFRRFDAEKFRNAFLLFCEGRPWRTQVNKFLFYADFKHFRDYSRSITGARYAHAPYGPCPDKFDHLFAWLAERGDIETTEVTTATYSGERIRALAMPDIGSFSTSEVEVLLDIKKRLGRKTSKALSDLSHGELGYMETQSGELISYKYAKSLRI